MNAEPLHRNIARAGRRNPADFICHALFAMLLAFNVVRTLRHAMWRDELQIFQIGRASPTLIDLFHHLRYEAHGSLWDVMVWLVTGVSADPVSMQVMQILLAAAIWILVWRWSPFSRLDKLLLLAGYFLFFEYFVISRSYTLAALFGFAFVALRQYAPERTTMAWLALGLLANLVMHATIWSIALAVVFVAEQRRRDAAFCLGGAIYLACLAFGIWTMIPAADYAPWGSDVSFGWQRLYHAVGIPVGALLPVDPKQIGSILLHPAGSGDAASNFWNPAAVVWLAAAAQTNLDHPLRLALAFATPVLLCWLIVRRPLRLAEFLLTYAGIVAFATLWDFPGTARHHGILFLALIATAWAARAADRCDGWSVWALRVVLIVGAIGGALSLASETRPFSQSQSASRWLTENKLADAFLIGSRDAQVSSVAGYLGRPVYYLECECNGTFIVWNGARQSPLSAEQFRVRLSRALDLAAGRTAILIRNRPLAEDEMPPEMKTHPPELLQALDGAVTDENFWIYRVSRP